jgi:hypothetical protein
MYGHASPSKALVKGLAKELEIDESFLYRLAEEVRKDFGCALYQQMVRIGSLLSIRVCRLSPRDE